MHGFPNVLLLEWNFHQTQSLVLKGPLLALYTSLQKPHLRLFEDFTATVVLSSIPQLDIHSNLPYEGNTERLLCSGFWQHRLVAFFSTLNVCVAKVN